MNKIIFPTQKRLEAAFKKICQWYFKDWYPTKAWKVGTVDETCDGVPSIAYTNLKDHQIEIINYQWRYVEHFEVLLIHEICHITSRASHHSEPWQKEMKRVIYEAKEKGCDYHSDRLKDDLQHHKRMNNEKRSQEHV